ncbi:MAG: galactokinase family protein [Promethearchaeota archaeon]
MESKIIVSAPGRICLFGDHQDYLGLTVIPAAFAQRTFVEGEKIDGSNVYISAIDINQKDQIDLNKDIQYEKGKLNYCRALINVFKQQGYLENIGLDVKIHSQVPLSSGMSSSAALLISFAGFLNAVLNLNLPPIEIAELAYVAEHDELQIPCGRMDQYSSALGGLFAMNCTTPPEIEPLKAELPGLIAVNSKVKKTTAETHSTILNKAEYAINALERDFNFDLKHTPLEYILPKLETLGNPYKNQMICSLKVRDNTQRAKAELKKSKPDLELLGELLLNEQTALRDYGNFSHPMLEKIIKTSLQAGALGGKLSGGGMGGSVVLLAPNKIKSVVKAAKMIGTDPYPLKIGTGLKYQT